MSSLIEQIRKNYKEQYFILFNNEKYKATQNFQFSTLIDNSK